jgi:hypothetical protein
MRPMQLLILLFWIPFIIYGQNNYCLEKLKTKHLLPNQEIELIFATSDSAGLVFFNKIGNEILKNLETNKIKAKLVYRNNILDTVTISNKLSFLFTFNKPAYVYMGFPGNKMPLCNRIIMRQINFLPEILKDRIHTTISISIDKEENAIEPLAKDIALQMKKLFKE